MSYYVQLDAIKQKWKEAQAQADKAVVVYAAESMSVSDPYNEEHKKQMEEWGYKRHEVPPMPEFK